MNVTLPFDGIFNQVESLVTYLIDKGKLLGGLIGIGTVGEYQARVYATHLFPMLLPLDDFEDTEEAYNGVERVTVTQYSELPWGSNDQPPYEHSDGSDCEQYTLGMKDALEQLKEMRSIYNGTYASHVDEAVFEDSDSLAVAIYCIDGKLAGTAAKNGGAKKQPIQYLLNLALNPDNKLQRDVFRGTPEWHAETNVLGTIIETVNMAESSQGAIWMLVDNPAQGEICTAEYNEDSCEDRFRWFKDYFKFVDLKVMALNNVWTQARGIQPGTEDNFKNVKWPE